MTVISKHLNMSCPSNKHHRSAPAPCLCNILQLLLRHPIFINDSTTTGKPLGTWSSCTLYRASSHNTTVTRPTSGQKRVLTKAHPWQVENENPRVTSSCIIQPCITLFKSTTSSCPTCNKAQAKSFMTRIPTHSASNNNHFIYYLRFIILSPDMSQQLSHCPNSYPTIPTCANCCQPRFPVTICHPFTIYAKWQPCLATGFMSLFSHLCHGNHVQPESPVDVNEPPHGMCWHIAHNSGSQNQSN